MLYVEWQPKVEIALIWFKRFLPILLILVGWLAWKGITNSQQEKATAIDSRYALVTAQVWLASATYRSDPAAFLAYRDSLMHANNIAPEEMFRHLEVFQNDLNRELAFSQLVSRTVDSLMKIPKPVDSTQSVDSSKP